MLLLGPRSGQHSMQEWNIVDAESVSFQINNSSLMKECSRGYVYFTVLVLFEVT
jgi:hypothetical protein